MLHPIDILDAGTGALLDSLIDPNLQLINPVNMPHPVLDVIITGSSGHVYCWRPEVRTFCTSYQLLGMHLHRLSAVHVACTASGANRTGLQ